jgi:hypothetical protein
MQEQVKLVGKQNEGVIDPKKPTLKSFNKSLAKREEKQKIKKIAKEIKTQKKNDQQLAKIHWARNNKRVATRELSKKERRELLLLVSLDFFFFLTIDKSTKKK